MSDRDLLNYITSYKTRTSCTVAELLEHFNVDTRFEFWQQIERLEKSGIIKLEGTTTVRLVDKTESVR